MHKCGLSQRPHKAEEGPSVILAMLPSSECMEAALWLLKHYCANYLQSWTWDGAAPSVGRKTKYSTKTTPHFEAIKQVPDPPSPGEVAHSICRSPQSSSSVVWCTICRC